MISEDEIKKELKAHGLSPNKILGQHFLRDETVVEKMIDAVTLENVDTIIEVGPGLGMLTKALAHTGKRIVAIEKDSQMVRVLEEKFLKHKNVEIVVADILTCNIDTIVTKNERYAVVANLPYNITARFLKLFLSGVRHKPRELVVMIQKEVAERMCAPVGKLTKLGLLAQIYSNATILINSISRESFVPPPKVLSAVVRCVVKEKPLSIFPQQEDAFWMLVRIGFSSKRKKLSNNLAAGLMISTNEAKEMLILARIDPLNRAEDLSIDDWENLLTFT